ncbi:MAG: helicase-related protein [Deltaproteobacteria bacterium]|nr:helicase-related protein [Deltaproteobacteria bacterium]
MDLQDLPIEKVKNVGLQSAAALRSRGILTVGDLLGRVPRRYIDLRSADDWSLVRDQVDGATVSLLATVVDTKTMGSPKKRGLQALLQDPSGRHHLRAVFFHAPAGLRRTVSLGASLRVIGSLRAGRGGLELHQPRVLSDEKKTAAIECVYPSIGGLSSASVGRIMQSAVALAGQWKDPVPDHLAEELHLPSSADALRAIHAPDGNTTAASLAALTHHSGWAYERLGYEELLASAIVLERARRALGQATPIAVDRSVVTSVGDRLGLTPTSSQQDAVDDISRAMSVSQPMRKLLVGDVGSGKTAVAAAASLAVLRSGRAVAWLAPTTIVAEQHAHTLTRALGGEGGPVALLLGSTAKRSLADARRAIREGLVRVVVGTQALLEDDSLPPSLGLAVIDEQHRFGVVQRQAMVRERPAHLLVISATPIPRTLAQAQFGDLDVVTMPHGPSGRQPVTSRVLGIDEDALILRTIERALEASEGRGRVFVVVPRIEADDATDMTIAKADELVSRVVPREQITVLHGGLSSDSQREALRAFRQGSHRVLLGTTVVEVGLDVPEANLMVILGAEHFGVAQLHQLRGRVGRGGQRAACLFVIEREDPEARARLEDVAACLDGFVLAERDLERRGAGEWFGEKQSGVDRSFRFADPLRHRALVSHSVDAARELLDEDPSLRTYPALARAAARLILRGQNPIAEDAG